MTVFKPFKMAIRIVHSVVCATFLDYAFMYCQVPHFSCWFVINLFFSYLYVGSMRIGLIRYG